MQTQSKSTEKTQKILNVKLEILSGPMDGTEFQILKEITALGRDDKNDIVLPFDTTISRNHARIFFERDSFWIEDSGSKNGIFLDGIKIKNRTGINLNTIFRLGISEMRLCNIN